MTDIIAEMESKGPVWIFAPYDAPPGDGWRALRSECLAVALRRRGYRVVLWMANFSYHTKTYRAEPWEEREIEPGFVVRFVPCRSYRKNLDWKRLLFEKDFAVGISGRAMENAEAEDAPSAIITREPPQILGHHALKLGKRFGCPVVSDVFDLWPEFFHQVLPGPVRGLGKILFFPLYAWRRRNWSRSDAVVALAKSYLEVPLTQAPAVRNKPHRVVYNGIDVERFRDMMQASSSVADPLGKTKAEGEIWAIYAGTLGNSYDIEAMLKAAEEVRMSGHNFKLLVAGAGPFQADVEASAAKSEAVKFVGMLAITDLLPLYRFCDIGLCAYSKSSNVEMPDKIYDYTAAGLPVVNSLTGEVGKLIEEHSLGLNYTAGDSIDLAAKISALCADPALRAKFAKNAHDIADIFSAPQQFDQYVDLIEELW